MEKGMIVVRGGGDIATGIVQKYHRAGFPVLVLEVEHPLAVRRGVSLCEAVRLGSYTVEDITARLVRNAFEAKACIKAKEVPMVIDPLGAWIDKLKPACVVDAIMNKRNVGTHRAMAPVVIGVGPGFTASDDVHVVIETKRGHDLGRMILNGSALPNTGIPGTVCGRTAERVVYAPTMGKACHERHIGDKVCLGETILYVEGIPCKAPFSGLLRGLIADGAMVRCGMKIADVDPRMDINWRSISDKARCVGGATLEAFLYCYHGGTLS